LTTTGANRAREILEAGLQDDLIQPFQVEGSGLRGRMVRLGPAIDGIIARHGYPDEAASMLSETIMLTTLLGSALKLDGTFSVQTQSDGPISMVVADMRTPGGIRGYARFDEEALIRARDDGAGAPVPRLLGRGYIAFTIDAGGEAQRYQGIVELDRPTLADCMTQYFRQSEQLETAIKLHAARIDTGDGACEWRAGGIMLQRLPVTPGEDEAADEAWHEAMVLLGTVTNEELVDPAVRAPELLFRLFHEGGVWIYEPREIEAGCGCSADKVAGVLASFPAGEVEEMASDGIIEVACEFCSRTYSLSASSILARQDEAE
jgi:molecular chaperone Hsp33